MYVYDFWLPKSVAADSGKKTLMLGVYIQRADFCCAGKPLKPPAGKNRSCVGTFVVLVAVVTELRRNFRIYFRGFLHVFRTKVCHGEDTVLTLPGTNILHAHL